MGVLCDVLLNERCIMCYCYISVLLTMCSLTIVLKRHAGIVPVCFNVFSYAMINMDTFSPKSGLILPHIVEISPLDMEIYPPWALFWNYSIVMLDLIYTNPIDHHQISSISYPYQCLFILRFRRKKAWDGKNARPIVTQWLQFPAVT